MSHLLFSSFFWCLNPKLKRNMVNQASISITETIDAPCSVPYAEFVTYSKINITFEIGYDAFDFRLVDSPFLTGKILTSQVYRIYT